MILPKTTIEREMSARGVETVLGVDEAGRGPLAGPVVAGAAWVSPKILDQNFELRELIRDSKTLSENQRNKIYKHIFQNENFLIGVGEVSHGMIDRLNILNASLLAMRLAVEEVVVKLKRRSEKITDNQISHKDSSICLLIDGNRKIPKIKFEQRVFVKGDEKIFSIAVASICAKVHRDQIMKKYHTKFPLYGFDCNKGYGTRLHFECLQKNGPCEIHRKSFAPVRDFYNIKKHS